MKVLIGTDGSKCSYRAIQDYIDLTHRHKHKVTILYVMPMVTVGRHAYLETEEERNALEALNSAIAMFKEMAPHVERKVMQGIPLDTIVQVAKDGNYDLLVLGEKGRGGMSEALMGSVTKGIIQKSPCSILIGK